MSDFKNIFLSLRNEKKYNQETMAKELSVSKSTIAMWETGKRLPSPELYEQIADYFNVDIDYLYGRTNIRKKIHYDNEGNEYVLTGLSKGVSINVLGRVAAGIPIEAIENVIDTEEISEHLASTGEFFGLKIHGDSMEPRMYENDVVIVRKQDDAESGDIVIAMVNGHDATCKRLMKYAGSIALLSLNPKYEPLVFTENEIEEKPVRIIGKVVELRGKL